MAGPSHHLITGQLTPQKLETLKTFLPTVAEINQYRAEGLDLFWDIQLRDCTLRRRRERKKQQSELPQPFLISVLELTPAEIEGYHSAIPALNLKPVTAIEIAAMMNNAVSRRWMAYLEIELLKLFGGYVDFLTVIYPPDSNLLDHTIQQEQKIMDYIKNVPGQVCRRYYDIEPGFIRGFTQIVDQEFLENWLQDDRFHFSK
jgi:Family of unknown function (DUF6368)